MASGVAHTTNVFEVTPEVTAGAFALGGTVVGLVGGAGIESLRSLWQNRRTSAAAQRARLLSAAQLIDAAATWFQTLAFGAEFQRSSRTSPEPEQLRRVIGEANDVWMKLRQVRLELLAYGPNAAEVPTARSLMLIGDLQRRVIDWQLNNGASKQDAREAKARISELQKIGEDLLYFT